MTKCIGCKCCVVACNEQNGNPAEINWRRVGEIEGGWYPNTLRFHLSMGCNHCLEPTYLAGCPVDAYSKDPITGVVLHSAEACIGCQYCTWNCSYGVPQYNPERGVVGKCDTSIRAAVSAGEALPAALFERFKSRFGAEILDGIGSTEALHIFISNRPGAIRPGSSGQVVPGCDCKLLNERNDEVSLGEIGTLWVKYDAACSHYWNNHKKTKDMIQGHWISTGDKYRQDRDRYFWYAGRSDDMLKVSGVWVSPAEIEAVLMEHEMVAEVAVVGRTDKDDLVKPVAWVVLRENLAGTPELARTLQDFVVSRLPVYKRPRWVEFTSSLPKTATGKIQRFKLRNDDNAARAQGAACDGGGASAAD